MVFVILKHQNKLLFWFGVLYFKWYNPFPTSLHRLIWSNRSKGVSF